MSTLERVSRSGAFSKGGRRQKFSSCFQYNQYTPLFIHWELMTAAVSTLISTQKEDSQKSCGTSVSSTIDMNISRCFSGGNCASMVTDSSPPYSPSMPGTP